MVFTFHPTKLFIFDEIHNNFPNFTITAITETEEEIGFCITILYVQCHLYHNFSGNKDQVSIERLLKHKEILLKQQLHWPDSKSSRDVTALFASLVFYPGGGGGRLNGEGGLYYKI